MSKTSCKLFTILNHDSCGTCDKNNDIVILCCDSYLKKLQSLQCKSQCHDFFLHHDCIKI